MTLERTIHVAALVELAAERALEECRHADKADRRGDHRAAERHTANARAELLAVYAKIGTLRHDGEQPKAVPA